jgi:hypothetical protein
MKCDIIWGWITITYSFGIALMWWKLVIKLIINNKWCLICDVNLWIFIIIITDSGIAITGATNGKGVVPWI